MYRAVAWRALQDGVPLDDDEALGRLARAHDIAFGHEPGDPVPRRVFIGDDEVTDAIRTAEIDRAVSPVSAAPAVREALLDQQRRIGRAGDYVVEGHATSAPPCSPAPVKVFLTASAEERASPRAPERRPRRGLHRLRRGAHRHPPPRRSGLLAPPRPCKPPTTPCAWIPPAATSKKSSTTSARWLASKGRRNLLALRLPPAPDPRPLVVS